MRTEAKGEGCCSGGSGAKEEGWACALSLSAIESALLENGEYNMEKIVADRLVAGKKEYLVKWEGYADKHNSWEPVENLANVVSEIAAYHNRLSIVSSGVSSGVSSAFCNSE